MIISAYIVCYPVEINPVRDVDLATCVGSFVRSFIIKLFLERVKRTFNKNATFSKRFKGISIFFQKNSLTSFFIRGESLI